MHMRQADNWGVLFGAAQKLGNEGKLEVSCLLYAAINVVLRFKYVIMCVCVCVSGVARP